MTDPIEGDATSPVEDIGGVCTLPLKDVPQSRLNREPRWECSPRYESLERSNKQFEEDLPIFELLGRMSDASPEEVKHLRAEISRAKAEIKRQKIARWAKPFTADSDDELQNALIWYGAAHLRQVPGADYTGQYETVTDVVLAVLLAERPHSRFITALGPILFNWADAVDFDALEIKLKSASKLRRLGWLVDNIVAASLDELLPCSLYPRLCPPKSPSPDVIDLIRSEKTFDIVWNQEASPISKKWGIVTSLQAEDFARVLAEVRSLQRPPQQVVQT